MYLCYDEAVQAGLKVYRTLEYAGSCRSAFRVASREFKEYMEVIGLPYSSDLAQQWVNDSTRRNVFRWSPFRSGSRYLAFILKIDNLKV